MTTINHSATMSIGGEVAGSWSRAVGTITGGTDRLKRGIASLKTEQRGVAAQLAASEKAAAAFGAEGSAALGSLSRRHTKLKLEQKAVEAELRKAQRAATKLGLEGSADVDRLVEKSEELARKERNLSRAIDDTRRAHERMAIEGSADVSRLRREHERFEHQVEREGRKLRRLEDWSRMDVGGRSARALGAIGSNLMSVGRTAVYAGSALAAAGFGGAAWFTKSLIETNASFETMRATLETIEGSSAKAGKAMGWISKFGANTPYEIGEVTEAFVKLRAYGLDPMDGTLTTLGDTASAMGKSLDQAVEAIADAVNGENERLKEFGIKASKSGDTITYRYAKDGKTFTKTANANSQAMIKATLLGIWNERYAGAMKKRVTTWAGMVSNLSDQWTFFQLKIGQAGVFDLLKDKLAATLEAVARWSEDGTLEKWADSIAGAYSTAFDRVEQAFNWTVEHWPEITEKFGEFWDTSKKVASAVGTVASTLYDVGSWAADAVGGVENLTIGLLAVGSAKTVAPLFSLAKVGWDIAAWLGKSSTIAGGLGPKLAGVAGSLKALLPLLGQAGLVAGAGAAGYYGAKALLGDDGEKALERFGESAYEWLNGDGEGGTSAPPRQTSARVRNSLRRAQGGGSTTTHNVQTNTINIHAPDGDPKAIAAEVERSLERAMRQQEAASHG